MLELVGSHFDRIMKYAQLLLDDEAAYKVMARGLFLYGDGDAADRIVKNSA